MHQGSYIGGTWRRPDTADGVLEVYNPAAPTECTFSTPFAHRDAVEAVTEARQASPHWGLLPQAERDDAMRRIQTQLLAREDAIARQITAEVGKPLWEAHGEASGLAKRVDLVLGTIADDIADRPLPGNAGEACFLPLGVVVVLGPFNFPAHLANGQILPALAAGNTVILKPSEKAAGVAALYAEAFAAADLPDGVFNLVQGDGRSGAILAEHQDVDAVLFTGSTAVGKKILAATHAQPHKLVALEMGGKNAAAVLDGADLETVAGELLLGATITCGQRCTATSQVFVQRALIRELSDRLAAAMPRLVVGDPLAPDTFIGPIIDADAQRRMMALNDAARSAGAATLCAATVPADSGWFVRPALRQGAWADHPYFTDEHFGPDLVLVPVADEAEAVAGINATNYGLAAAVFCPEQDQFRRVAARLRCGVVNWNRSTVGASGSLPFGGWRNSGNHRPGAAFAGRLVTAAQARLNGQGPLPAGIIKALENSP
jgi:succinylglutamic semialdehyde dehydrogenase